MKKILLFVLALSMFCFVGCSSEEKTPIAAEILASIRSEKGIDLPDMADITVDRITGYYDVKEGNIEELAYIIAGSGATADEIMVVKMTSAENATDIAKKMEDRKAQITDLFKTYNPDEMPKIESCVIETKGNYAFFAICNDNEKAKKIFKEAF